MPEAQADFLSRVQAFYDSLKPTTIITVTDGWSPETVRRLQHVQASYPEVRLCAGQDILGSVAHLGFTLSALDPREFYYAFPYVSLSGRLLGLYLRAVVKEKRSHYVLVDEGHTRCMPFGFFTRPKWVCKKHDDPLWVCEGVFDCLALQTVHPYVVAAFGGSMTWGKAQVMGALASNIVCYFDSDDKGKKFYETFRKIIASHQPDVVVTLGRLSAKDPGTMLDKGKIKNLEIAAAWNSR